MAKKPMIILCKMNGRETELPCSASGCPLFGDCLVRYEKYAHRKQTNADRIRAMSDEELADIMSMHTATGACNDWGIPHEKCGGNCRECIIEWLKQPAEVE